MDKTCACIRTRFDTPTIQGSKITNKKIVCQVFRDKRTKAELFRIEVGDTETTWWNYGIATEGDFNGDGIQDYAWYGGDDTGDEMYVFLSSDSGYHRLDVHKAMEREWARSFHSAAPDFGEVGGPYSLQDVRFLRDATGLSLLADAIPFLHPEARARHLRVVSSNFVFTDK